MNVAEQTKLILSINKIYRDAAGDLMDEALARHQAKEITDAQFQDFRASCYEPILGQAVNLLNRYDASLADQIDPHISILEERTKELKAALKSVKNVEKVVGFAALVLAAIVSTAAFIVAPTPASGAAAVAAIGAAAGAVPSGQ